MPEGPECRLTTDYLSKIFLNKTITNWVFCGGKYTDSCPEGYHIFDSNLPLKVHHISCKGKLIYFILQDEKGVEYYILHSPRMTGKWQKNHDNHCKWFVELTCDKNDVQKTIWFSDIRGFATLQFTDCKKTFDKKLNSLGPDIMRSEFKLPLFRELVKKYSNRNITAFLSEQEIISGCGNYIKSESLYYAKISPLRKTGSLNDKEVELLYEALRIISRISYNNMGLDNTAPVEFKIYGKDHAICAKTADGKTTYWDKKIQN
jgi:formamidopyrimidine-DNA glycosylase